jgi:hypothetical protein
MGCLGLNSDYLISKRLNKLLNFSVSVISKMDIVMVPIYRTIVKTKIILTKYLELCLT